MVIRDTTSDFFSFKWFIALKMGGNVDDCFPKFQDATKTEDYIYKKIFKLKKLEPEFTQN